MSKMAELQKIVIELTKLLQKLSEEGYDNGRLEYEVEAIKKALGSWYRGADWGLYVGS
jgi:hypothetical protein